MLLGRYQHTLDAKGRVFVPAKLRETLGERFVATKGKDVCICIYPMEEWSRQEAKLLALPSKYSDLQRFYFSNAAELEPDKQGRVLLPADLREYAGLENDVVIMGVGNRVEIWNATDRQANTSELTPQSAAMLMDELGI